MSASAEQSYRDTINVFKTTGDIVKQMIEILIQFCEDNKKFKPYDVMGEWLKKSENNIPIEYKIKNGCNKELTGEMYKHGIPYVMLTNGNVLIRPDDLEIVRSINREVNIVKQNYYQEIPGNEFEDAIVRFDGIKDKTVFVIKDLNEYQLEVLKNKVNTISKGFTIGITTYDEEHSDVIVQGSKVFNANKSAEYDMDLCKAYLSMQFSLYGENNEIKIAQIESDKTVDKNVASLKGNPQTHYIVGAEEEFEVIKDSHGMAILDQNGNPQYDGIKQFIEIDENGFIYKTAQMGPNNEIIYDTPKGGVVDIDNPDYELELQKYMDMIRDKSILNSPEELRNHLLDQKTANSNRPQKTAHQLDVSVAERSMVDKIDRMIKERVRNEKRHFDDPNEAFLYYRQEADTILKATRDGKIPPGYKKTDIENIFGICKENGINFKTYGNLGEKVCDIKTESRKARKMPLNITKESEHGNEDR